jgi:NAD-dependent DNA ligase
MQIFPEDWGLLTRINYLQRKIILNSILYYEYDMNSLDDHFYDDICKQLVKLQFIYNRNGDIKKDTNYGYVYYDFDGSTGYHLYKMLNLEDRSYLLSITDLYINKKGR